MLIRIELYQAVGDVRQVLELNALFGRTRVVSRQSDLKSFEAKSTNLTAADAIPIAEKRSSIVAEDVVSLA